MLLSFDSTASLGVAPRHPATAGMLLEQPGSMLSAARGVACRLRHRTAAWGCSRLASTCTPHLQPPAASSFYHSPCTQSTFAPHQRHSLSTFAALNIRESPTVLDPGDYEAGQIQVSATCSHQLNPRLHSLYQCHHGGDACKFAGPRRARSCAEASWHVHRKHWSKRSSSFGQ